VRQEGEVIERILLASDGPGAWTAAAAVADLVAASQTPVEVEVLHVNEVEYRTPPEGSESTDPFPERRRLVDELVADLRQRGISASGKVRSGRFDEVADDIVDEAEVAGAGLIAMSCRPRSLIRYAFTGSVSQAVIMRAGCPVMVVREPGFRL
jgi:nucleotide-binding universal stress UspA family protein